MRAQHRGLKPERWQKLTLCEQLANVGAEVGRTINWRKKNKEYSQQAFYRALELLFLTIGDPKNQDGSLKELVRLHEVLVDYFAGENQYGSTDQAWEKYFLPFNYAARKNRV